MMATTLGDNFEVLDGLASVRDRVLTRLRMAQGEWYLAPSAGVPYVTEVLGARNTGAVAALLKRHVLGVADVVDVQTSEIEYDAGARHLRVAMRVESVYGSFDLNEVVV